MFIKFKILVGVLKSFSILYACFYVPMPSYVFKNRQIFGNTHILPLLLYYEYVIRSAEYLIPIC